MMKGLPQSRLFVVFGIVSFLYLTGCASQKKNTPANDPSSSASQEKGMVLELNGDSDSQRAGGLKTVFFPFDSSEIGGESQSTLDSNAQFLKNNNNVKVQIEGHCDERGGVQYNMALGERRARAIQDYLKAVGITSDRISTISFGKEKPLEMGHDESAWEKNRRGNFVVTEK
jgi:peptidoglycan-associated lipoprotein